MQLTFSSGITVRVRPPGRAKAVVLAVKAAQYRARPGEATPAALSRAITLAGLIAPYVDCTPPRDVDKAAHLVLTVLKEPDDWEQLANAIFAALKGQKRR